MSYEVISTVKFPSGQSNWTGLTFSSIPSNYRTLEIKYRIRFTTSTQSLWTMLQIAINGTTATRGAQIFSTQITQNNALGPRIAHPVFSDPNWASGTITIVNANISNLNKGAIWRQGGRLLDSSYTNVGLGSMITTVTNPVTSLSINPDATTTLDAGSQISLAGYL